MYFFLIYLKVNERIDRSSVIIENNYVYFHLGILWRVLIFIRLTIDTLLSLQKGEGMGWCKEV